MHFRLTLVRRVDFVDFPIRTLPRAISSAFIIGLVGTSDVVPSKLVFRAIPGTVISKSLSQIRRELSLHSLSRRQSASSRDKLICSTFHRLPRLRLSAAMYGRNGNLFYGYNSYDYRSYDHIPYANRSYAERSYDNYSYADGPSYYNSHDNNSSSHRRESRHDTTQRRYHDGRHFHSSSYQSHRSSYPDDHDRRRHRSEEDFRSGSSPSRQLSYSNGYDGHRGRNVKSKSPQSRPSCFPNEYETSRKPHKGHDSSAAADESRQTHGPYAHLRQDRRGHLASVAPGADRPYESKPMGPQPPFPTPSYLSLSKETSTALSDPSLSRKLLILDLNGTLLHRPDRTHVPKYGPRLRPVHPRPYMAAFRSYLFTPETKSWLDVMVWSSAQPHSVADMVDKCFGEQRGDLVAIWARDTLGLSDDQYNSKVQTLKDLSKPWSQLPALHSLLPSGQGLNAGPSAALGGAPSKSVQVHSALTTLLLDDSPLKAAKQPYNHVCIREYDAERRALDLESFRKEQDWEQILLMRKQLAEKKSPVDASQARKPSDGARNLLQEANDEDRLEETDSHKFKKPKLENKRSQLSTAAVESSTRREGVVDLPLSNTSSEDLRAGDADRPKRQKCRKRQMRIEALAQDPHLQKPEVLYDETLLAVIGILDHVKRQSNVAAWLRAGGVWGPVGRPGPIAGNDGITVVDPVGFSTAGDAGEISSIAGAAGPMWFEYPATMDSWARRGRRALEELDIPVEHGMVR